RQHNHIEYGEAFQEKRVCEVQGEVYKKFYKNETRNRVTEQAASGQQDGNHRQPIGQAQFSGRKRAKPFVWMTAVGRQIQQIVYKISAGSDASECRKREKQSSDRT